MSIENQGLRRTLVLHFLLIELGYIFQQVLWQLLTGIKRNFFTVSTTKGAFTHINSVQSYFTLDKNVL